MKSSITVIIAIISNTIDKQSGGRGLHRLLDCRETDVVRNRWEINNVSETTKELKKKVTLKLKPYLETHVVIQQLRTGRHLILFCQ